MAETMRTKILTVLAEASEPLDIQRIAEGTGSSVKSVTEALSRLNIEQNKRARSKKQEA